MNRYASLKQLASSLSEMSEVAVSAARKQGAEVKVAAQAQFDHKLVYEYGKLSLVSTQQSQSLGLVAHKNQRKGSASTNVLDKAQVERLVNEAVQISSFSVPDEALIFAKDAPTAKPLEFMFTEQTANLTQRDLEQLGKVLSGALTKDKRVSLERCEISLSVSHHQLMNSLGVRQSESQSMLSWSYFGMGVDGEEVTGFDYDNSFSYIGHGLEGGIEKEATAWTRKLISSFRPQKAESYKGLVLFTPRAFEEVILGQFLYHASGSQVMDGRSRWVDKVGEQVLPEWFSVSDRPHFSKHMGATAFDGDGLPTHDLDIISKGRLCTHLHDCYTANRVKNGAKSTATSGGPFGLSIASGKTRLSDLYSAAKDILVVDRFSGNVDPISGSFSGVAKSSRRYVSGQDRGPVSETMIAGNIFDNGFKMVEASQEVETVSGAYTSPYVLIDGITVSAG